MPIGLWCIFYCDTVHDINPAACIILKALSYGHYGIFLMNAGFVSSAVITLFDTNILWVIFPAPIVRFAGRSGRAGFDCRPCSVA